MNLVKDSKIQKAERYYFDEEAEIEKLVEQNKRNWIKAELDIAQGKAICLTDLIGGAEKIHIKNLERNK